MAIRRSSSRSLSAMSYLILLVELGLVSEVQRGADGGAEATKTAYSGCATSWASRWRFTRCSDWCLIGATTIHDRYKWR